MEENIFFYRLGNSFLWSMIEVYMNFTVVLLFAVPGVLISLLLGTRYCPSPSSLVMLKNTVVTRGVWEEVIRSVLGSYYWFALCRRGWSVWLLTLLIISYITASLRKEFCLLVRLYQN